MFAVGSNPDAANVSGVNVTKTIIAVFTLAGVMYGVTGFIEAARIGSNSAATGLNYELDAIAACVIGGVSFVGGIGKISGVIIGVVLLRIIFVGLQFVGIDANMQYVIKGSYNSYCMRYRYEKISCKKINNPEADIICLRVKCPVNFAASLGFQGALQKENYRLPRVFENFCGKTATSVSAFVKPF